MDFLLKSHEHRLGEYLVRQGLITSEHLKVVLYEQSKTKEKFGNICVRFGFCTREEIVTALVDTNPKALTDEIVDPHIVSRNFLIITKTMIVLDEQDLLYFGTMHDDPDYVAEKLYEFYPKKSEIKCVKVEYNKLQEYVELLKKDESGKDDFANKDVNILIKEIIDLAIESDASDIHLETSEKTIHLRYRIDGILHVKTTMPLDVGNRLFSRIKGKAGMDVAEKRMPQDGSFSEIHKNRQVDFRVSTIPGIYGEKITIRILDKEKSILSINQLGITKEKEWIDLCSLTNGIILVCGATGSGKTTTLYSTVKYLDSLHKAIYTIEDPIEYNLPFITQVQVNRKIGLDFAYFMRTVLRHDPDICIVGEIRDKETAENAVRLADTGHLVYATLHTNDVQSSLTRIKDLSGGDIYALSYQLRGIMVQKLIRKMCPKCEGVGCGFCSNSGYKGRTLLTEFARTMFPEDVEAIVRHNYEYYTFYDDANHKLNNNITNLKEIKRVLGNEAIYKIDIKSVLNNIYTPEEEKEEVVKLISERGKL